MRVKIGDYVEEGDVLATLYTNDPSGVERGEFVVVEISGEAGEKISHVLAVIHGGEG